MFLTSNIAEENIQKNYFESSSRGTGKNVNCKLNKLQLKVIQFSVVSPHLAPTKPPLPNLPTKLPQPTFPYQTSHVPCFIQTHL